MSDEKVNKTKKSRSKEDPVEVQPVEFSPVESSDLSPGVGNIELLLDVSLPVTVELGRASMSIKDLLVIGPGSVIELDRLVGTDVDILANQRVIAKGEVMAVDENFGVRITSLIGTKERIQNLSVELKEEERE